MKTDLDEVLTDRQLADIMKVHWKTIQHLARLGDIRGQKIGKKWRFHRDAVRDYLLSRR